MAFSMMSGAAKKQKFKETTEIDMAYGRCGAWDRFRCERVSAAAATWGLVLRVIPTKIRALDELFFAESGRAESATCRRGLVLVTGGDGARGQIDDAGPPWWDRINSTRAEHIITIEDPIEFLHRDKKRLRESTRGGKVDTPIVLGGALRASLRQDPDVILVGENARSGNDRDGAARGPKPGTWFSPRCTRWMRVESVNRIIAIFPAAGAENRFGCRFGGGIGAPLSAQRLVRRSDAEGRVPAGRSHGLRTSYITRMYSGAGKRLARSAKQFRRARRNTACRPSTSRSGTCSRRGW